MIMSELVSVIVPIYNAEKYLKKCIDSIIYQTYINLEIILINDGSTDGTDKICSDYARIDKRINYIKKDNSGQSDTRNYGIDISNGKYIFFMDSDDYVGEKYIEYAVENMTSNGADLSICNYYHVYKDNEIVEERKFLDGLYDLTAAEDRYNFIINVFLPYKCGFEVWNRLYDAEIIKNNNLKFQKFSPVVAEDVCFNFIYLMCSKKISVSNERFYYYVSNDSSTMAINSGMQLDRYNEVSKIAYSYIKKSGEMHYIDRHYFYIHILLIYHEIMNCSLQDSKVYLSKIEDKDFFLNVTKIGISNIATAIRSMGVMRGVKYTLLGMIYKNWIVRSKRNEQ